MQFPVREPFGLALAKPLVPAQVMAENAPSGSALSSVPPRSPALRRRVLLAALLVALWLLLLRVVSGEDILNGFARVSGFVDTNPAAAVAIYVLAYVTIVTLTLPISVGLTILGGAVFGPAFGFPLTVVTATLGACIAFAAARGMFHGLFMRRAGRWLGALHGEFHSDAASYLVLLRIAPVLPFVIVNLIAALLGARFRTFAVTTFFGIMPGTLAFTLIGAGMKDVLWRETRRLADCRAAGDLTCTSDLRLDRLVTADVLIGLAALASLVLISIVARRILARRTTKGGT